MVDKAYFQSLVWYLICLPEVSYVQIWRFDLLFDRAKKNLTNLNDPKEIIQQRYHQKLIAVLIPALEDFDPRYFFMLYHDFVSY